MKKYLLYICIFTILIISGCGIAPIQPESQITSESHQQEDTSSTENIESEEIPSDTSINDADLTEEEYKNLCQEMYHEDFFDKEVPLNAYVKFYALTSKKIKYGPTDVQGMLVSDITEQYNLDWSCLGCATMWEKTKDDAVPSYFGESIFLMFENDGTYSLDSFNTGEHLIVYGKIIQTNNGIFVLPRYIEPQ